MAQQVMAIAYDKMTRADEALLGLVHLQQEHSIDLADAVVVVKAPNGKLHLRQTTDITAGRGAATFGWWGFFLGLVFAGPVGGLVEGVAAGAIGALYGRLVDSGINDDWIKEISERLTPGTSAIFILINSLNRQVVATELGRYEGHILYSDLPDDVRTIIEHAQQSGELQTYAPTATTSTGETPAAPVAPPIA